MTYFLKKMVLTIAVTVMGVVGFSFVTYAQTITVSPVTGTSIGLDRELVLEVKPSGYTLETEPQEVLALEVDVDVDGQDADLDFWVWANETYPAGSVTQNSFTSAGGSISYTDEYGWTIDFGNKLAGAQENVDFYFALRKAEIIDAENGTVSEETVCIYGCNEIGSLDKTGTDNKITYVTSNIIFSGIPDLQTIHTGDTKEFNGVIDFSDDYTISEGNTEKVQITLSGNLSGLEISTEELDDETGEPTGNMVIVNPAFVENTIEMNLNLGIHPDKRNIPVDLTIKGLQAGTYTFSTKLIGLTTIDGEKTLGDFTLIVEDAPISGGSSSGGSRGGGRTGGTSIPVVQQPTWETELAKLTTIQEIQAFLNAKGFGPLTVDGMFGDSTALAIDAYKKSFGETTTPVQTPSSTTKLETVVLLKLGVRGEDVRKLQMILNEKGFGPLATDGIFGQGTRAAVIKFQIANGLSSDGIVGAMTQSALNK